MGGPDTGLNLREDCGLACELNREVLERREKESGAAP